MFHIGESDLGDTPIHHFKYAAVQFCNTAKLLLNTVQPYKQSHIGMFVSLCLPQPWYMGWNSQSAAQKAQVRLNGSLGWAAALSGSYVVVHPEISPNDYPAFINPNSQELSSTGIVFLMVDIKKAIRQADPNFKVPTNFNYKAYQQQAHGDTL